MTDALKLSKPSGKELAETSKVINALEQAELKSRTEFLEKNIADLTKALDNRPASDKTPPAKKQAKSPPAAPPGKTRHAAHPQGWKAITTQPDLCRVGKDIVAFDSCAALDNKHQACLDVKARGTAVYRQGDMFSQIQGDAGQHIVAGTSGGSGYVKILDGHASVKVNSIPIARHDSKCLINCNAAGVGGALGKLVTEQKSSSSSPASSAPSNAVSNPSAPPGERTSEKLDRLKDAKAKLESGQLDFNALDEFVNFKEANKGIADAIGSIKGIPGTAGDYTAQATRGVLGFGKDIVMGIGELAYEGVKAVPKLGRMLYTSTGQAISQLDGQILAENMRLGNITPGTVGQAIGQGALDIGAAIIKPVTDPWAKGQYVEAVTRAAAEIATLPIAWTKAQKAAQATKIKAALELENAAKAKAALELEEAAKAKAALDAEKAAEAAKAGDGVHVKAAPKRPRPDPNGFDGPEGYKTHGLDGNPLKTAEGRELVEQYKAQGLAEQDAIAKASDIVKSGSTPLKAVDIAPGDALYKIVPEGQTPGKYSAYFATEQEIQGLKGMSYDQISDRIGIPLESQQTARFDVVRVTATEPTTVFESTIARTTQNGYEIGRASCRERV